MPVFQDYTVVDRVLSVSPLGIRFWDAATQVQVDDGLQVTARPASPDQSPPDPAAQPVSSAVRSFSGIYAFRDLPGLRLYEHPAEIIPAPVLPGSIPEPRPFLIEVFDAKRRFVPVVFQIDLPRMERGIFPSANGGSVPDDAPPGFYLFSSVSRGTLAGIAVLRANLTDETTMEPAAHAVLDVEVGDNRWIGLADEEGRGVVMFPYPPLTVTLSGSFPEGGTPLFEYEWPMTVRIRYEPGRQHIPVGSTRPTLQSILAQQYGLAFAGDPESSPPADPANSFAVSLRYGEDAIIRTPHRSELLVQPATSIP